MMNREEAIEKLKEAIKPGDTLYTVGACHEVGHDPLHQGTQN